jgi:hypothetical protein
VAVRRDGEIVVLPPQLHVPAAHGDVVEEDVAAGRSARRGHWLIQQESGSGVGAPFQEYRALRVHDSIPASLSAGPNSTRCSVALLRNPDLTSSAWPEEKVRTGPAFSSTTGRRAALSMLAGEGIAHGHVGRRLPIHEPGQGLGRAPSLLRSPRPAHDDAPVGREVRGRELHAHRPRCDRSR